MTLKRSYRLSPPLFLGLMVLLLAGTLGCQASFPALTATHSVATGGPHSFAILSDNTLWAFGANHNGELGDGSIPYSLTPVQVILGATP